MTLPPDLTLDLVEAGAVFVGIVVTWAVYRERNFSDDDASDPRAERERGQ